MNYTIDTVDDCIFDYLVSNVNVSKSLDEIYCDITKDVGHRCSDLPATDYLNLNNVIHNENQTKFLIACYTLDFHFKNIYKVYKNGTIYLIYGQDLSPIHEDDNIKSTSDNNIIDCLMNPKMYNSLLVHYCIKKSNLILLEYIMKKYSVDTDSYIQLINLSVDYNNKTAIEKIIRIHLENVDDKFMIQQKRINDLVIDNKLYSLKIKNLRLKNCCSMFTIVGVMTFTFFALIMMYLNL